MAPRKVTFEEFRKLECNQCGERCEDFTLPWPLELVTRLGVLYPNGRKGDSAFWHTEYRRRQRWIWDVEPIAEMGTALRYRCNRLVRHDDGTASCSAYEGRPMACEQFPFWPDKPIAPVVLSYTSCSWHVEVVDAGPGRRPNGALANFRRTPVDVLPAAPSISDIAQHGWAEAERLAA